MPKTQKSDSKCSVSVNETGVSGSATIKIPAGNSSSMSGEAYVTKPFSGKPFFGGSASVTVPTSQSSSMSGSAHFSKPSGGKPSYGAQVSFEAKF